MVAGKAAPLRGKMDRGRGLDNIPGPAAKIKGDRPRLSIRRVPDSCLSCWTACRSAAWRIMPGQVPDLRVAGRQFRGQSVGHGHQVDQAAFLGPEAAAQDLGEFGGHGLQPASGPCAAAKSPVELFSRMGCSISSTWPARAVSWAGAS